MCIYSTQKQILVNSRFQIHSLRMRFLHSALLIWSTTIHSSSALVTGFSSGRRLQSLHVTRFHNPTIFDLYNTALHEDPTLTKAITNACVWGISDLIAQQTAQNFNWRIDLARASRFALTGLGAGILWSAWYDALDALTESLEDQPSLRAAVSVVIEQFFFCPFFFSLYLIPMSSLLVSFI